MLNKKFSPSAGQIRAARFLLAAMAHESLVSPVVTAYQTAILASNKWPKDQKWIEMCADREDSAGWAAQPILNPKHTYLLSDEDFATYRSQCLEAQARAGLVTETPDHCPKLSAEYSTMQAQQLLVKELEPVTGITWDQLAQRIENIGKYVDLSLKMLAPFVGDSKDVLEEVLF